MIIFDCDIGYSQGDPVNMSDITWLDRNVKFTILQNEGELTLPDDWYRPEVKNDNVYSSLYNVVGQGAVAYYCVPGRNLNHYSTLKSFFDVLKEQIPSVDMMYPKAFEFANSYANYVLPRMLIYFPQLNSIITPGNYTSLYKVNGDIISKEAELSSAVFSGNYGFSLVSSANYKYYCDTYKLLFDGPLSEISNYKHFRFVNVTIGKSGTSTGTYPTSVVFSPKLGTSYGEDTEAGLKLNTFFTKLFGDWQPPDDDPFAPGGDSEIGGGGGDFDNTTTPIEIPGLPSISAASTGFISLFNPSLSQLNELSQYLWSDLFEIDGWKKLFADPMDAILGLSILPVQIPSSSTKEVKVGNIGTGITLNVANSQFVEVDCGSINVNEYWGAYLDYEPYTQAQIFLPYIGTRPISVDEIMGKTVSVVYHVDILTGACCCFVKCGDSVLYTYNGQCSIPIPITGANYTSVVNGVISVAASVGSLVATGGASAPTSIPAIASSVVNQMKPQIEKSGSISGSAGVLNMQTPYLILIRPRQALPSKQNEFIGYPSLITVQLTELSGYTEVQSIHLENIPATQEELTEIQSLLEGGVIF